jgi:hypothetical protein
MKRNYRFWEFVNNSWVKVTLSPDQTLTHFRFSRDDEGWSRSATIWEHDSKKKGVFRIAYYSGTDCDGRIDRQRRQFCAAPGLAGVKVAMTPTGEFVSEDFHSTEHYRGPNNRRWHRKDLCVIYRPDWEEEESSQRDFSAEAAGY